MGKSRKEQGSGWGLLAVGGAIGALIVNFADVWIQGIGYILLGVTALDFAPFPSVSDEFLAVLGILTLVALLGLGGRRAWGAVRGRS